MTNKKTLLSEYLDKLQIEFVILPTAYGIYQLYQRFLSNAAKHCKKKKGKSKTICMLEYKIIAIEKAIQELERYKVVCQKFSLKKERCIEEVNRRIEKLKKRLYQIRHQLEEVLMS